MIAHWAAEKLGLSGAEADSYALSIVMAALEASGEHDVTHKIRQDFDAKGVVQSDHQIERTMTGIHDKGDRRHQSRPLRRRRAAAGRKFQARNSRQETPSNPSSGQQGNSHGHSRILSRQPAASGQPVSPRGAACPIRSSPKRSAAKASRQSRSTASTDCGTSTPSSPPSPRFTRPARRRSCACRSAISPPSAARSISAPKASSRR